MTVFAKFERHLFTGFEATGFGQLMSFSLHLPLMAAADYSSFFVVVPRLFIEFSFFVC